MEDLLDSNLFIILLNMGGWVVVGYLIRDYFQETKSIKNQLKDTLSSYNEIKVQQKLQEQRLDYLDETVISIKDNIEKINNTLAENNQILIQELKEELRKYRESN